MSEKITMSYPEMLAKFRKRRNEFEMMLPIFSEMGQTIEAFKTAESCLSFGPGMGDYDLEFMKSCLPNLKTFVAVEKNPDCAAELKISIDKVFNGKVDYKIFLEDAETWNSKDEKFDVIIMFHVLYCIYPRLEAFFKNVFDNLLKPEGLAVILNTCKDADSEQPNMTTLLSIFRSLNEYQVDADVIKAELTKAGGKVIWSQRFKCSIDLQNYDDDILFFFNAFLQKPVDRNTLRPAIELVVPDGKGCDMDELFVLEKNS